MSLQREGLNQLHVNNMDVGMIRLLAHDPIYWINLNNDIENYINNCPICLEFQATQPKDKTLSHGRSWE